MEDIRSAPAHFPPRLKHEGVIKKLHTSTELIVSCKEPLVEERENVSPGTLQFGKENLKWDWPDCMKVEEIEDYLDYIILTLKF